VFIYFGAEGACISIYFENTSTLDKIAAFLQNMGFNSLINA